MVDRLCVVGQRHRKPAAPPPPGFPLPPPFRPHLKGASCPSASLCVAVSANGDVFTTTNPLAGNKAWVRTDIDGDDYDTHVESVSCRLDRRPLRRCKSPRHYWVSRGRHVFRVRAIGPTGLRGPFAIRRFRVHPPPKRRPVPLHPRPDSDNPGS